MNRVMRRVVLSILFVSIATPSVFADEGKTFKKRHPRRAEVLGRASREENKNNAAAVNGAITDKQAARLDHQDNLIKKEEQADANANGGKITKSEQRDLNRQENRVNRERRNMEKRDAAAKTSPGGTTPSTVTSAPPAPPSAPGTN